jgi:hypothetical protein
MVRKHAIKELQKTAVLGSAHIISESTIVKVENTQHGK